MDTEKQMEKLNKIFDLLNDGKANEDEMAQAFQVVLAMIHDLRQNMTEEMAQHSDKMESSHKEACDMIDECEARMKELYTKFKGKVAGDIDSVKRQFKEEVNRLENLIPTVKDYDYLETQIKEVEAKIPKATDLAPVQNDIKNLQEDVEKIKEDIEELKKRPTRGGGGTSPFAIARAFEFIFHTEQPSGAINGSNTVYTVQYDIWAIIGFTLNGESIAELPNFTFANKTITFSSALPAAYSGKDFEIKYIGS